MLYARSKLLAGLLHHLLSHSQITRLLFQELSIKGVLLFPDRINAIEIVHVSDRARARALQFADIAHARLCTGWRL